MRLILASDFFTVGVILFLIAVWFGALALVRSTDNEFWIIASFVYLMAGGFAIVGFCIGTFVRSSPENKVANELKFHWQKPTTTQPTPS